jgi:hypothetical protein
MAKGGRWTGVGSKVGEMPRADLLKSGHWRAVYLETRQHGSGRGGWKRTRSRLAVTAEANGRVNELRRKPSTSPAAYSTIPSGATSHSLLQRLKRSAVGGGSLEFRGLPPPTERAMKNDFIEGDEWDA